MRHSPDPGQQIVQRNPVTSAGRSSKITKLNAIMGVRHLDLRHP